MLRLPNWLVVTLALILFVGLAMPVLAADTKGKIKSISTDNKEFVLTDTNNKDWTFQLHDDAKIRLNDKDSRLQDLKEGDEVQVTYEKKNDKLMAKEVRCDRK